MDWVPQTTLIPRQKLKEVQLTQIDLYLLLRCSFRSTLTSLTLHYEVFHYPHGCIDSLSLQMSKTTLTCFHASLLIVGKLLTYLSIFSPHNY